MPEYEGLRKVVKMAFALLQAGRFVFKVTKEEKSGTEFYFNKGQVA